ncbi:MAG: adenosylcobinamide-GDP ribazoletransferase [Synechococcales cyanobacterium CRU_2_2]|nr:adenosylcobinamide-GDP ribazoletransferase [Synechococcales cyanobacterium CRU_2_2]
MIAIAFSASLRTGSQFLASLTFYTSLPFFNGLTLEFRRIARFAPIVGLLMGALLGILNFGLFQLQMPLPARMALVLVTWIALTGGLHLDGAMDTADGLAVMEPHRRLAVMADSVTGAFGVMAAIALVLLKYAALLSLPQAFESAPLMQTASLMAVAGWGRWGQVLAIARYPYLKPEGKGAFHKREFKNPQDLWWGLFPLLGLSAALWGVFPQHWMTALGMTLGGFAIAFSLGEWFNHKLGGHTGDTYGAVVEWTEALLLCLLTVLS